MLHNHIGVLITVVIALGFIFMIFGYGGHDMPDTKIEIVCSRFFRWLKGSRTNYYLSATSKCIERSFDNRRGSIRPVIEVNHGLFRRRSTIYGNVACNWYIKNAPNGLIYLHSRIPMRPDQALQIINTSLSVHDLYFDQSECIAKLEKEIGKFQEKIAWTESHRKTWLATLEALRQEIESDRQRYRSQAAQNIRIRVGQVLEHAKSLGQIPDDDSIDAIKRLWIVRDGGTTAKKTSRSGLGVLNKYSNKK